MNSIGQTQVTISLDNDILNWFYEQENGLGYNSYEILINIWLRQYINNYSSLSQENNYSNVSDEEKKNSEELNLIFNLLLSNDKSSTNLTRLSWQQKFIYWKNIAPNIWERLFLIGLAFFLVASIFTIIIYRTILPEAYTIRALSIYLFSTFLFFLLFLVTVLIKEFSHLKNKSERIIQNRMKKIRQETLNDRKLISHLSKNTKGENLNLAEKELKFLIDKRQLQVETIDSFSPILGSIVVIYCALIFADIFAIPLNLGSNLVYIALPAILGALILPAFNFISKSGLEPEILRFKKYVLILEQARAEAKNIQ